MTKLLIVDDSQLACKLVKQTSDKLNNVEVEMSNSVDAAISLLSSQKFDCVITDLNMPEKSGLDLVAEARKFGITTPIVVLSSKANDELREQGKSLGANGVISKPITDKKLKAVLAEHTSWQEAVAT